MRQVEVLLDHSLKLQGEGLATCVFHGLPMTLEPHTGDQEAQTSAQRYPRPSQTGEKGRQLTLPLAALG